MRCQLIKQVVSISAAALAMTLAAPAQAVQPTSGAIISNGTIFLGVNSDGSLNYDGAGAPPGSNYGGVGLFDGRTFYEATYPGCTCEGWGAAAFAGGAANSGGADTSVGGNFNLTELAFNVPNTFSANSLVAIDGDLSMQVLHQFLPSSTPDLYQVNVFITNTSSTAFDNVVYRRTMDWDIDPTPFNEVVTIQGVRDGAGNLHPNILYSSNDGFSGPDPLDGGSFISSASVLQNFTDLGPNDHGALFDFQFGPLDPNDTVAFKIFYGASSSEMGALNALNQVGAEIYSLGQPGDSPSGDPVDRGGASSETSTFIFGFDIDNDGSSFAAPLLPTGFTSGGFVFETTVSPGVTTVIDPVIAIGYDIDATENILTAEFQDLGDPDGYDIYLLSDLSTVIGTVFPTGGSNAIFDFGALFGGSGIPGFRVGGIDPSLGLDPTNPLAFAVGLTFDVLAPTPVTINMNPVTAFVAGGVPEPSTWAMLIFGFGFIGGAMRHRRRQGPGQLALA